ncbi:uncharacterized protein B0I36DRAFT_324955 [Microdochium trichocladiopsis]|uniref:Uncharacterized protein n=1 Tax=Microdochium trichocladiopsis TaxID=1682393 RepID=A0A9P9BSP7_9PEZI|nr:uncharacterized protein B0I36DRAFT_324955 [Microdochium trichocladiopsis]KAH7029051.1 hypothetical protein B0I36DRAFT_324955 [Microdochium trichocladiopsis]
MSSIVHPLSAAALFNLSGWVAVITGGGTGVGLMMAKTLAANGAKVYITGRREDVLKTSADAHGSREALGPQGGSIVPLVMDVTSKDSIKAAVQQVGDQEGHVDVLINNAGVWSGRASARPDAGVEAYAKSLFDDLTEENFHKAFETNCAAMYFVTAAFLPLLVKAAEGPNKKPGNVINNTSVSGSLRITQNGQFPYNASKAAANHLTRQLANDFHHDNIRVRVNGFALGMFPSEMTLGTSNEQNESTYDVEQFRTGMKAYGVNLERMGTAQELGSTILNIATNDYIWGNIITVDGGWVLSAPGNF